MNGNKHSIYAIICPKSKKVRYVGCTSKTDVRERVLQLSTCDNKKLREWLKTLKQQPIIVVLDKCERGRSAAERIEAEWIKKFHLEGHSLFNVKGTTDRSRHPIKQIPVLDLCGKINGSKSITQILEETKNKVA